MIFPPVVSSDHWVFPNSCNIKMNVITFLWFRLFTVLHIISRGGARRVRSPPALHSDMERGRWLEEWLSSPYMGKVLRGLKADVNLKSKL